jgi:hypothetical protein
VRERGIGPSGIDRAVGNAPHGTTADAAPIGIIFQELYIEITGQLYMCAILLIISTQVTVSSSSLS